MLTAMYNNKEVSLPVAFELVQKTKTKLDPRTEKNKKVCDKNWNEMFREMLSQSIMNAIQFKYVLADSYFCNKDNLIKIKSLKKEAVMVITQDRKNTDKLYIYECVCLAEIRVIEDKDEDELYSNENIAVCDRITDSV